MAIHAESKSGATYSIRKQNVVYAYFPAEDFIKNYNQIFGVGIILPGQQQIITG
jgi:homospermidine synthase